MNRDPIRVALIGCGAIAELGHAPALSALADEARVTSVVDTADHRRNLLGSRLGVPAAHRHHDVDVLLAAGDPVDLAVLVLPPRSTPYALSALLEAGTRVLAEKPMTTDVTEAALIADRARRHELGVVHNYLHRSDVRQALARLGEGQGGEVRFLRLEQPDSGHFPGAGDSPHWRRSDAAAGCLVDNAYHWVYVATELAASPVVRVTARTARPEEGAAVDLALILLEHANGVLSSVQSSWCAPSAVPVLEVHTTRGTLRLEGDCGPCTALPSTAFASVPAREAAVEPSYTALYREVFAALRDGRPFAASADDCATVLRVLTAADTSARTGGSVSLDGLVAARPAT
ncbi:Gfo/Idh/MocA family oxidoreductase [Streptomyces luomodiensis]|uniref:Gfo/Idh/MocA family oxidoreductase n=1 Tax=Streptomyces luomodiensis TaxID=3026192 RepID=A0ABY9UTP1_9ACTN|nr:Gfo/Idh/MocA family oxidoreductase [Streptomyces sp. SCA4-21]WNE93865.1 Gfo/Idh/MocA family oxidoreductase [Streptomyces sp. SCA4-21]